MDSGRRLRLGRGGAGAGTVAAGTVAARVGCLVALAVALHAAEGLLPVPPVPGARLGLANLATLLALESLGGRGTVAVAVLRSVAGGLVSGGLGGPGFLLGVTGSLAAAVTMCLLDRALRALALRAPSTVLGIAGALAHNGAQLGMARWLCGAGVWAWAPWLAVAGVLAGWAVGRLAAVIAEAAGLAPRLARVASGANAASAANPAGAAGAGRAASTALVAAALALAALAMGTAVAVATPGQAAREIQLVVEIAGQEVAVVPLTPGVRTRLPVALPRARAIIEVSGGRARILRLPARACPRHICSHRGWIVAPGEALVCLPNRLVVRIEPAPAGAPVSAPATVLARTPARFKGPSARTAPAVDATVVFDAADTPSR